MAISCSKLCRRRRSISVLLTDGAQSEPLSTVAFHCVALADTVYAPAGDAWEEKDDAAIEAEFDLGMRALIVGALAMRA